jgi:hypothetical protein
MCVRFRFVEGVRRVRRIYYVAGAFHLGEDGEASLA